MLELELSGERFRASPLLDEEALELQALLMSCADYFEVALGRPPGAAEAQAVFDAGPEEGQKPEGKMLLGIRLQGSDDLAGVLDAFRDYPAPDVWYIGLLLLSPAARDAGVGTKIMEAFAASARSHGARELQLNVVEQNERAHRFWLRCGFAETTRWRQRFGERESTFIRMRRFI